jgi:KipI family sensor histidine kinase inhibitor
MAEPVASVELHESGDAALRVLATSPDRELNWATVHGLTAWLQSAGIEGIHGGVPTYDSVLVEFDASLISASQVRSFVGLGMRYLKLDDIAGRAPRRFEIPVAYGGMFGPDLEKVAEHQGISPQEVIELHTAKTYRIRCLGSPAGSPMMDGPDFPFSVPRLKDPRLSVPAGAVSVAGKQAVIAPAAAPGGWCVIGQTPLTVLDITQEPLVPYLPGDELRFHEISVSEFERLDGRMLQAAS